MVSMVQETSTRIRLTVYITLKTKHPLGQISERKHTPRDEFDLSMDASALGVYSLSPRCRQKQLLKFVPRG